MGTKIKSISVIIPVYNSADTIVSLHRRIVSVLTGLVVDYEIIFINDASTDTTLDRLKKIRDKNSNLNIINNEINLGQSLSIIKNNFII